MIENRVFILIMFAIRRKHFYTNKMTIRPVLRGFISQLSRIQIPSTKVYVIEIGNQHLELSFLDILNN